MKIRHFIYIIMAVFALAACDEVSINDRYIYIPPASVNRSVLIEDFTGQRCVNCPDATEEIERLQEQYGEEEVIAVGIHSGPLGVYPTSRMVGLRTQLGDDYYNYWRIDAQPMGVINRNSGNVTWDKWGYLVYNAIQQEANIQLGLFNNYDEDSRTVSISLNTIGTEALTGKVQVWLIENNIVAPQMMQDGTMNRDYVHNHVLRAAVNGMWGDDFTTAQGEFKNLTFTATLDPSWEAKNMAVVAFVYNDSGVLNVIKTPVTDTEDE